MFGGKPRLERCDASALSASILGGVVLAALVRATQRQATLVLCVRHANRLTCCDSMYHATDSAHRAADLNRNRRIFRLGLRLSESSSDVDVCRVVLWMIRINEVADSDSHVAVTREVYGDRAPRAARHYGVQVIVGRVFLGVPVLPHGKYSSGNTVKLIGDVTTPTARNGEHVALVTLNPAAVPGPATNCQSLVSS